MKKKGRRGGKRDKEESKFRPQKVSAYAGSELLFVFGL